MEIVKKKMKTRNKRIVSLRMEKISLKRQKRTMQKILTIKEDCFTQVFAEIFLRLPVKTLLNLVFVCRSWNSIITDPTFAQRYLQRDNNKKNALLLTRENNTLKVRRSDTFELVERLHPSFNNNYKVCHIVGHADGVLLVHIVCTPEINQGNNTILLWNPTIPKIVSIPSYPNLGKDKEVQFGFGFDVFEKTYKVVAVNLEFFVKKTKVYNLRTRTWALPKAETCEITPILYLKHSQMTTNFDGGIYWLACAEKKKKRNADTHLLRFDLSTEAFSCCPLPALDDKPQRRISILRDSLALLDTHPSNAMERVPKQVRISVLKGKMCDTDTSVYWDKVYTVKLEDNDEILHLKSSGQLYLHRYRNIRVKQDGDSERFGRNLVRASVIDLETEEETVYPSSFNTVSPYISFTDAYQESLALLNESNDHDPRVSEYLRSIFSRPTIGGES